MAGAILSRAAERDLADIWAYIAANDVPTADAWLGEIERTCETLSSFPGIGRRREDLGRQILSFPIGAYIVFYRPTDGGIELARILHGSRDIDRIF